MGRTIAHDLFDLPERNSINSKQKGNRNELEAAKWMERWTGHGFTRVPSSGGLHWKNNSSVCGDIVCKDEGVDIPFSVETKHLKKVTVNLKLRSNSVVLTIWEQAVTDAERGNKIPLCLLRENGMPKGKYLVVVPFDLGILMEVEYQVVPIGIARGEVRIYPSDDIMALVGYKDLIEAMKEYKYNFGDNQKET